MEKKVCNKWTNEEIEKLKELFPYKSNDELVEYFNGRSKNSIINKANKLGLKKAELKAKEGFYTCKKCNRELPWNSQYYPKMKNEKNPRKICRECNPKYGNFLKDDFKERVHWSKEEEELFISRYPYYTNEELREKFYPNLTDKQLSEKAYGLGVSYKNEEAYWRARKQQSAKMSIIMTGKEVSEETRRKLSEKRKQQYKDGTWIPSWLGRVPSKEEREKLSKRVKGLWSGKNNPRYKNPLKGKDNPNWNGGITYIYVALRENIKDWKVKSMELCNYKCAFTGRKFDEVHHIFPFNKIVDLSLKELELDLKSNLGEYSEDDRIAIINKVKEKHAEYGLGICLSKEIHKLFHSKYSFMNFTVDDFKVFIEDYFNGKYDDELEDRLKSINSSMNLEEVKKLASFYYA